MSEEKQTFVNDTNIADENLPDRTDLCTLYDAIADRKQIKGFLRIAVWSLFIALLSVAIGKGWLDWVTFSIVLVIFIASAFLALGFSLLVNQKREKNFHHYADLLEKANRQLKAEEKDEVLSGHSRKTILRVMEVLQIKEINGELVLPVDVPDEEEEDEEDEA